MKSSAGERGNKRMCARCQRCNGGERRRERVFLAGEQRRGDKCRPVKTRHLSKTIDNLVRLWPLNAQRKFSRLRVKIRRGVIKDKVAIRLSRLAQFSSGNH